MKTEIRNIQVERWSVISSRPFEEIVTVLGAAVGHPEIRAFSREISAAGSLAGLETIVERALGPSGFMEFMRLDLGGIVASESRDAARICRFIIGNPLVMKEMVKHVSDAASYAPVTVLIAERGDSVCLSYDRMASFIAPYGSVEASKVALDLDTKIESLLSEIAR
jgi:hypothetical protein